MNFNNLKLNIKYQDSSIKQVTNFKILEINIDENFNFQINNLIRKPISKPTVIP